MQTGLRLSSSSCYTEKTTKEQSWDNPGLWTIPVSNERLGLDDVMMMSSSSSSSLSIISRALFDMFLVFVFERSVPNCDDEVLERAWDDETTTSSSLSSESVSNFLIPRKESTKWQQNETFVTDIQGKQVCDTLFPWGERTGVQKGMKIVPGIFRVPFTRKNVSEQTR